MITRTHQCEVDAFGDLYERYLARTYRYVHYRVDDVAKAEDLTEMVFLKAWEALEGYQTGDVPFGAWLYRIVHNVIIDRHHTRKVTLSVGGQLSLQVTAGDPQDRLTWHETIEPLAGALSQMSPVHQQALALRFTHGLSHSEIALVLDRSEEAIRVLQFRALNTVRALMAASLNSNDGGSDAALS